jgi:adenine-specific DNA-methyltransferase
MSVAFGAVYTRPWTANLILDLAGYLAEENLVDVVAVEPSAGDGAFLIQMVERLVYLCRRQKRQLKDCAPSIIAYELDGAAAGHLRRAVEDKLTELGASKVEAQTRTTQPAKNLSFRRFAAALVGHVQTSLLSK